MFLFPGKGNDQTGVLSKLHPEDAAPEAVSAASIRLLLDDCATDGRLKPGHKVLMATFGGGLTGVPQQ
ncbi:MAG: acyl-carrier-protein synthase terminal [Pseudonocardiales bacterium]|nr:acyl-carrier-protein synthase terminal [Pseudonocardiales bacterium]